MKRTSTSSIGAVGLVVLVLGLTWCSNPFKHFNHTGGIAYYKQGVLPYFNKEMNAVDAPFTIEGSITDSSFVGTQVAVIPVNADSVGLSYMAGGQRYSYIQSTAGQFTTGFFSIRVIPKTGEWPQHDHDIYYFSFLK